MNEEYLTEEQINEELQRMTEALGLLPMLGAAVGGKMLLKRAVPGALRALKYVAKRPIRSAVVGYGVTHPKQVKQALETGKEMGKEALETAKETGEVFAKTVSEAKKQIKQIADFAGKIINADMLDIIAKIVVKYGLPLAAVLAIIYGGKKLFGYMMGGGKGSEIKVKESLLHMPTFKEYLIEEYDED